ncbi:hypothetical protein ISS40_08200 [Candidatus Bathyarchaeota archaeon]|nr:hypothetical protein [Candidatus Bathyarchaeota archaeon]MBL7168642.1 hypothetical protein [Candidatus Bathyarchaeota archaeon]
MSLSGHAPESPKNIGTDEKLGDILDSLFDIEEGIERGSDPLRRVLGELLGRIIEQRIGYYILPMEDED